MTNASRAPVDFEAFARDLQQPGSAPVDGAPLAKGAAPAKSDPLAELARIVGQDDPFRALLAARDDRREAAAVGPAPSWDGRVEPSFAPDASHPSSYPGSAHQEPSHHGSADTASYRNSPADAFDQYLASVDHGAAEENGYGQDTALEAEPQTYEGHGLKRVKPRRRLFTVGAAVALVTVAVTGALTYKGMRRGGSDGGVPVVQADTSPIKVAPKVADGVEIPDQNRQIYEPKIKDSQIRIVNREEQPLDVAQAARAGQGGPDRGGSETGSVTPGAAPLDAFGQPRRVRTVVVKPDTPPAAPREAQTETPTPISPIPTMTLPGDDAPAPRVRPGRMAAATPQMPIQAVPIQQAPSAVSVQARPTAERTPVVAPPATVRAKAPQRVASVAPEAAAPVDAPATTAATASSNAAVGGFSVQLGVRTSAREAETAFREMQGKYGQLAGKPELIRQAEVNGKTIFRVRVGPLAKAEATTLCSQLQGAGGQCFVAKN